MNNFLETPADNLQLSFDNIIFCKLIKISEAVLFNNLITSSKFLWGDS